MKRLLALAALAVAPLLAAIDGTVTNRTTGKPAARVTVTLIRPGQNGMTPLGSAVTDVDGKFHFDQAQTAAAPTLLQANYQGINYNKLLTPNMPASGVDIDVYEPTKSPAGVRVVQRMLIFEPNPGQMALNETVILQNDSNRTFHDPDRGDFLFYLPPAANGQVRVNAQGPGGMPLPRAAEKTKEQDIFKIDFPIKPGETQFEIMYHLPAGSPQTFHGRVVNTKGMQAGPLRLVAPAGVELSGSDIARLGTEPKSQATIYNVLAKDLFTVQVSGTGALHNENANTPTGESDSPPVTQGPPRIYAHLPSLLALAFGILGVGLFYLLRTSPVEK